jgi:hypothetical protein
MNYDYIIIGGGPTGLALSWYLSKLNKRILLIDREDSLGGCHRVKRVNGLFSEHGPRIYLNNYLNFITILNEMGKSFDEIFTKYSFSISTIGGSSIKNIDMKELFNLTVSYIYFMIDSNYSKNITMLEYSNQHNFNDKTKDYIDRLCRLTDGASIERYTLYEFFQLLNQNLFYNIYQPKLPNDVGLFKYWRDALLTTGNVDIMLNTEVIKMDESDDKIVDITVSNNNQIKKMSANQYIFAIPPQPLLHILNRSKMTNIFSNQMTQWTEDSEYIIYIPIIYHWSKEIILPKVWGFPSTDWGIVSIVLSDYMKFDNPSSKTVISTAITITDKISKYTGKTANQSTVKELRDETFRQLRQVYPDLDEPIVSILSPAIHRNSENNGWTTEDTAFMFTKSGYLDKMQYKNMYTIGPHSGKSKYSFTTLESAVTNALYLALRLEPQLRKYYRIEESFTLNRGIFLIIYIIIVLILLYYFK